MNQRRTSGEDAVRLVPVNRIADHLRMNAIDGALKIADAHDTVDEIRLDIVDWSIGCSVGKLFSWSVD